MLTETSILYILVWSLCVFTIVAVYKLFGEKVYKAKYKTSVGIIANLNGKIRRISQENAPANTVGQGNINANDMMAQFQNMSYEQVAQELGVSEKDYNNPLMRPMAEKYFELIKNKMINQGGDSSENEVKGY